MTDEGSSKALYFQATAVMPCLSTRDSSFRAGPEGFFSPRSHLLDQVRRPVQVIRKGCPADMRSLPESFNLRRRRRPTSCALPGCES
jgi:hypothetical protein